jgi:undecaprenyl-diphosphatase
MVDWWKVILLGAIEGFTEFLPISSTGHMLIAAKLLQFTENAGGTFEIFIQLGAIIAVIGYYARDLLAQARAFPTDAAIRRFWFNIVIAFLPAAAVGALTHKWIKAVLFGSPTIIAWALILGGIVLIIIERLPKKVTTTEVTHISFGQALGAGVAQITSLVPGVSRSGATIVGGLLGGVDRPAATRFSFYLAIPTLLAATLFDLVTSLDQLTTNDLGRLALGLVVAMVTAWISIDWLLRYVARNTFVSFGIYRIGIGILILILVAVHWL